MKRDYEKCKGIHPGVVLKRELDKRDISQLAFANALSAHHQTINAIVNERRNLNTSLAINIEEALGVAEGSMLVLQAYYDIKKEKENQGRRGFLNSAVCVKAFSGTPLSIPSTGRSNPRP